MVEIKTFYSLKVEGKTVFCDTLVTTKKGDLVLANIYHRSENLLRSLTASIAFGHEIEVFESNDVMTYQNYDNFVRRLNRGKPSNDERVDCFIQKIPCGSGYVTNGIVFHNDLKNKKGRFFVDKGDFNNALYNKLYAKYTLPLLREWMPYIADVLFSKGYLEECLVWSKGDEFEDKYKGVYLIKMTPEQFDKVVSEGLRYKRIKISDQEQAPLVFNSIDEYFARYGRSIVEKIIQTVEPVLKNPKDWVEVYLAKDKFLPKKKQAHTIQGVIEVIEKHKACLLNGSMGTGKTGMAAIICDMHAQAKLKQKSPELNLRQLTEQVSYRVAVMCPGHLPPKWLEELLSVIPLVNVTIVDTFEKALALKTLKGVKPKGKEIFIFPRDFSKLSYSLMPAVTKYTKRVVRFGRCRSCGRSNSYNDYKKGKKCTECGESRFNLIEQEMAVDCWICPECGEPIFPSNKRVVLDEDISSSTKPIGIHDFGGKLAKNSSCNNCGTSLWQPRVKQVKSVNHQLVPISLAKEEDQKWLRITRYANKAQKGTVTEWVHKDHLKRYKEKHELTEGDFHFVKSDGTRKYAPALFIKEHLGSAFFDYGIFDECHELKGGGSAQGHAFHVIANACKYNIAMTGTLAGGYASNFFYLLFRLFPWKMVEMGFEYHRVQDFVDRYGVKKQTFKAGDEPHEGNYNSASKGRSLGAAKEMPGISPMLYTDMLIDFTVFIDLMDMSHCLPTLTEKPILVQMAPWQEELYSLVKSKFDNAMQSVKDKFALSSVKNHTLASLPDKPFNLKNVIHPQTGQILIDFERIFLDLSKRIGNVSDMLLPKEELVVNNIKELISKGQRVFVYADYTGEGDKKITDRLKAVFEANVPGAKVAILTSKNPKPAKRLKWIKDQAHGGANIIITNPSCVRTGLDFKFEVEEVVYNYNNIIFNQVGNDVYTLWQASYRHLRMNQDLDCNTWYYAYENTVQHKNLTHVATKKHATSAVQGRFSSEGLSAMANGTDSRTRLAEEVKTMTKKDLEGIFDKVNIAQNDHTQEEEINYYENLIYSKLPDVTDSSETVENEKESTPELPLIETVSGFSLPDGVDTVPEVTLGHYIKKDSNGVLVLKETTKKKGKTKKGQLLLFDF